MPTGPEAFLGLPDASELRTHLKNGLVSYSLAGGAYDKYPHLTQLDNRSFFVPPASGIYIYLTFSRARTASDILPRTISNTQPKMGASKNTFIVIMK